MKLWAHPQAEAELKEAARYYAKQGGAALGRRFLDEYDHLCARLLVHPKLGAPRGPDRRGIVMRTFPYTLIYELSDAGIRVLVVKHNRRNPDHGLQRR